MRAAKASLTVCRPSSQETRMNVESLSQKELLTLLSILEGELEARDLVIESLRAQRRDAFVQERYGKYNLSDPFLALQRDGEVMRGRSPAGQVSPTLPAAPPSPLAVLKLVMSHCKRMQEKMLAQLAAAESRHRKVIADLEEEKRRHAQDTAEGDDVTCMLEKERERLLQQLGFESSQVKRMQKEQRRLRTQLEESRLQHKQLTSSLAKEGQRGAELSHRLEEERAAAEALRAELEAERRQALRAEARAEEQLAEFDTEKEQLRAWLRREEGRGQELQAEVEQLRSALARLGGGAEEESRTQTDSGEKPSGDSSAPHKLNGHHGDREAEACKENGCDNRAPPPTLQPQQNPAPVPCHTLGSSPCSSPLLARHPVGVAPSSPSYQASYQAGIHQRFHATRHKFQGQPDPSAPSTPSAPTTPPIPADPPTPSTPTPPSAPPEPASVKQLARNTLTQALSRFTGQQGGAKPAAPPSSPTGSDCRSPPPGAAPTPTRVTSPISPGVKSPIIPRAERGHPPPIPPKKPGLAQTPMSPGPSPRASHFHDLSSTCGLTSSQEGSKEPDLVLSSTS
ncbi:CTTNBP2 N-terminal-like protein [Anguilla anguilla]|uniref:CTTNBP2 N-terminal-like protein n=1 Tax=Anguilla anguilla TaxID=7936 RepID=UPI0015ADEA01|nr:CTTNBP2 N-terminal-like protein [Anguilla anguilla]